MEVIRHQLGAPISQGRRAELYSWPPGKVLKLYREDTPAQWASQEAERTRAASEAGVRVPQVGGNVEINHRQGILFEQVHGSSLLNMVLKQPWRIPQAARLLAALHARLHTIPAPTLPSLKEQLERQIRAARALPGRLKVAALIRLRELPDSDRLCHGSFHPRHILLTVPGPVVIDWLEAGQGEALADVSSTVLLLDCGSLISNPGMQWMQALARYWFRKLYLQHYFQMNPGSTAEYDAWLPVVGAAHLAEECSEERDRLLAFVEKKLADM